MLLDLLLRTRTSISPARVPWYYTSATYSTSRTAQQPRSILEVARGNQRKGTFTLAMSASADGPLVEREAKRSRINRAKSIGTHNGTFHCDEALACFLLKLTSTYRDAVVVRTRDPKILDDCDIVVDVGGVYDHNKRRYDHHQRGFDSAFGHGFVTKLSSAGLIYNHYGKEIIAARRQRALDDPQVELLWLKLYKEFIEAIDGIDNGLSQYPKDVPGSYRNRTDLSSRVSWLNPAWNERVSSSQLDDSFARASAMTGEEFLNRLDYYAKAWIPARDIVVSALTSRKKVHPSGRIVVFEQFAPWKEHLFDIEQEHAIPVTDLPLYVVYPDETASNWRVQAIPIAPDSFESRKALPETWRGVRDTALSELTGIPGCVFVHASGFIGGNATKEGVVAMAVEALE